MSILLGNIFRVVPIQLLILLVVFYALSRRYSASRCLIFFVITFFVILLKENVLLLTFVSAGIYCLGYLIRLFLEQRRAFSISNLSLGFVTLFFPLFTLSILSTFNYPEILSSTVLIDFFTSSIVAKNICLLLFLLSIVLFVVNEKEKIVLKVECFRKQNSNEVNGFTFLLVTLILSLFCYVVIPVINYDDLATHYYIQNQFSLGNYPSFDVSIHVWAVSQWIFDIYYGLFESIFNDYGRSYLNLLLAVSIFSTVYSLLRNKFGLNLALLVTLLSFSSPVFVLSLTTSQTELISLFLLVNILYFGLNYTRTSLLLSLPLFAMSVSIKPSNAVIFIFPLFIFIFIEYYKYKFSNIKNKKFVSVFLISCFIAFGMYIFAYLITGNPFFPLYNSIFRADHFPNSDFFNSLYSGNFNFNAFFGVIFNTSEYLESGDGVAGFQLLFLPLFVLSVPFFIKKNTTAALMLLSVVVGGVLIFYFQQYVRYLMPMIFVLTMLYALMIADSMNSNVKIKSLSTYVILLLVLFNFTKVRDSIWYLGSWNNNNAFSHEKASDAIYSSETILFVNNYLNSLTGKVKVMYHSKPYAANINGEYVYTNWYNTAATTAYHKSKTDLLDYIRNEKITHIVLSRQSRTTTDPVVAITKEFGELVYQDKGYDVYKIDVIPASFSGSEIIKVGSPSLNDDGNYIVTSSDFYIVKYINLINKDKLNVTYKLGCNQGDVWRVYLEYNRDSDFSNFFQVEKCPQLDAGENFEHTVTLKIPNGTDDLRVFLQPISGKFEVISVTLKDF